MVRFTVMAGSIAREQSRTGPAFRDAGGATMITVYRAPIEEPGARAIAAYLGATGRVAAADQGAMP
ncbi:hypothetical protein MKK69_21350 [Methylobacterium sp. J-026]|uniref:hypothetical protein n=1 Tax=Methylobacterium sp. J-026 TaxID=2836624 RepID=UPI001FBB93A5|nr:hypothetical protein [Methylobacterium sp. J-026]MCJ2136564.1 hypothetical protein [Methylobacterium sp. J-026]